MELISLTQLFKPIIGLFETFNKPSFDINKPSVLNVSIKEIDVYKKYELNIKNNGNGLATKINIKVGVHSPFEQFIENMNPQDNRNFEFVLKESRDIKQEKRKRYFEFEMTYIEPKAGKKEITERIFIE
jgi:hypothetical protein